MIKWYVIPYVRKTNAPRPSRYVAINTYSTQIKSYDGKWQEIEVLGDRALVKVRAPQVVHTQLDAIYKQFPTTNLDDTIPSENRESFKNELLDMGYTLEEIQEDFNDGAPTLRDWVKVATKRRRKPRYDSQLDEIIVDGDIVACEPIGNLDMAVVE